MKKLSDYREYLKVEIKHANTRPAVDYALYVNVLSNELAVAGLVKTGAVLEQCHYVKVVSSIAVMDVESLLVLAQQAVDKYRADVVCKAAGLYLAYADAKRGFFDRKIIADEVRECAEAYYRYCVSNRLDGAAFRVHVKSLFRQFDDGNQDVFGNRELARIFEACCLDV